MGSVTVTTEVKEAKLDLQVLQSQLSSKDFNKINEGTLLEIKRLSEDPDYGEEFVDMYRDHLNILKSNPKYKQENYLYAIKFFCSIESGCNITDAYIKTFPERFKKVLDNKRHQYYNEKSDDEILRIAKEEIRSPAARYNKTQLLNDIRKVAGIPVQLVFRHLLYDAIETTADLMHNAKSDLVKQKAAECLIKELKPDEEQTINVNVNDGSKTHIEQLVSQTERFVIAQKQFLEAGGPIGKVIDAKVLEESEDEE